MASARDTVASLILEGRFGEAFRICESVVRRQSGDEKDSKAGRGRSAKKDSQRDDFFLLAGSVCLLGLGHVRQAEDWTAEAETTNPAFYYVEALIHLHAGRTHEALLCYTRLIDEDPSDTFADRLIEKLRAEPDDVIADVAETPVGRYLPLKQWFSEDGSIRFEPEPAVRVSLLDRLRSISPGRRTLKIAGAVLAGVAIAVTAAVLYVKFRNPAADLAESLPDAPAQGTIIPLSELKKGEVRYTFESRKEVIDQYDLARKKVIEGKVNEARVLLNEIDLSNAGFELKERALLLKQMIPYIDPSRFIDNVEIQTVIQDPDLYQGVQVLWPGEVEEGGASLRTAGGRVRLTGKTGATGTVRISGFFQRLEEEPIVEVREILR